jgi:hypothetical protein
MALIKPSDIDAVAIIISTLNKIAIGLLMYIEYAINAAVLNTAILRMITI